MKLFIIFFLLFFKISFAQNLVFSDSLKKSNNDSISKVNYDDLYAKINMKNLRIFLGKEIPFFIVKDVKGYEFDSSKTKRLVIYNFWHSGCFACVGEVDIFNALQEKFKDQVEFISMTFDTKSQIEEFEKKHPSNFRQFSLDKTFLKNLDIYGGYPTTILVLDGKIIKYQLTGVGSQKTVNEKLFSFGTYYKFRSAIEQALVTIN